MVVLADHERVGTLGLGGAADCAGHCMVDVLGAQPAGHVGDVDPPAVDGVRRPQPPRDHAVRTLDHGGPQLGVGEVELGEGGVAHPAFVGAVVMEVVPAPGRGRRVGERRHEPLVRVAGVVGGEVAEQPQTARVHRVAQPVVGVVATEHGVDPVERRGVVAVVALAREHRRRVDDGGPEPGHVVEVVDDPVEVAAVQLQGRARVAALVDHLVVPGRRDRPRRRRAPVGREGAGEAVGEDLVDEPVAGPVRCGVVRGHLEVERVRPVVLDHAGSGHPALARAAHDQEAVVRDGVVDRQLADPPDRPAVLAVDAALVEDRLGVVRRPDPDRVDRVGGGDPQPNRDGGAELGRLVGQVERRAVVVRLVEEVGHQGSRRTAPGP